jgi:hypothetical protein
MRGQEGLRVENLVLMDSQKLNALYREDVQASSRALTSLA